MIKYFGKSWPKEHRPCSSLARTRNLLVCFNF